jgi:formylglycine-generating enzyme required for sulfatase activity
MRWLFPSALALVVAWCTVGAPPEVRKFALVVGANKYDSAVLPPLKYAENDAEELARALKDAGFTVRLLTTRLGKKKKADAPTAANVRKELAALLEGRKRGDTVLVAMSGHGVQLVVDDPDGKGDPHTYPYFCPTDADMARGTINYRTGQAKKLVNLNTLFSDLADCGAGAKLVLIDACRNKAKAHRSRNITLDHVTVPKGVGAMFSCASGQVAYEVDKLGGRGHGLFFHFVLEGLKGKARNSDDEISWSSLADYATTHVSREAPKILGDTGLKQTPQQLANIIGESPVLVRKTELAALPERPKAEPVKYITNSIGMKFAYIPEGKFKMGSSEAEQKAVMKIIDATEKPSWLAEGEKEHEVEISKGFYLGVYEVTQKQYREVMKHNPSHFSRDGEKGDIAGKYYTEPAGGKKAVEGLNTEDFPVDNVSWDDAQAFIKKLNALEKEKEKKRVYRLPSEAEWEYACRGGAAVKTVFHFGNSLSSTQANFNGGSPFGGADKGKFLNRTCKVGSYKPNGFGLYDMHGNVWEWCQDTHYQKYYSTSPKRDPVNTKEGPSRVLRGGGCSFEGGRFCRSASRDRQPPTDRCRDYGFRVALVPPSR